MMPAVTRSNSISPAITATALALFLYLGAANAASVKDFIDSPEDPELRASAPRSEKIGKTSVSGSLDVLTMIGIGGGGVDPSSGYDFTLRLDRHLFTRTLDDNFDLHIRMRYRGAIGDTAPSALAGQMGAVWGIVDGFTDGGFEIPEFFFRQRFPKRDLELRYGQMVIDSQLDTQSVGGSKSAFLNRAFSSSPAVAFPRLGAGFTAAWDPEGPWSVIFGLTTVQGTDTGEQVNFDMGSSEFFKALQFGYTFKESGSASRRLQWLFWESDAVEDAELEAGSGSSITYDYHLAGINADGFARLAWASGGATSARIMLVNGLATEIRPGGRLGFGLGIGRGIEPNHWQGVAETFYRREITENGGINFNLQVLGGQGFIGSGSIRVVGAIGCRFFF